jgi:hypothetical protein
MATMALPPPCQKSCQNMMKTWNALVKKNWQIAGVSVRCINAMAAEKARLLLAFLTYLP